MTLTGYGNRLLDGGKGGADSNAFDFFASPIFNGTISTFMSSYTYPEQLDHFVDVGREALLLAPKAQFTAQLRAFIIQKARYRVLPARRDVLQRMYEGDYWQGGAQWMGPLPQETPDEILYEIARYMASRNFIKECVDRHFDAIVSDDPRINITVRRPLLMKPQKSLITGITNDITESLKQNEQDDITTYESAFTNWYDSHDIFTRFVEGISGLITRGSALYRIYIPFFLLDDDFKLPKTADISTALDLIRIMPIDFVNGAVIRTAAGDVLGGWYAYKEGSATVTEIHYVDQMTGETVIEMKGPRDTNFVETQRLDLGGRLLIAELRRKHPFVTPQAMKLNNLLNVNLTMLGRNLTLAGFLERIFTNVQMPGNYVDVLDTMNIPTGEKKWVPAEFYVGTSSTNVLIGVEETDDNGLGTGKRATPGVHFRDPVDVTTFKTSDEIIKECVYAEFKQQHVLIASSHSASGRSREQALNDFSASVRFTARIVNRGLSNIFDTIMALAAWICDDAKYVSNYKLNVSCRMTMKLLSPDEIRVIMEMYDRELLSAETSMLEMGHVSNPDAEFSLIDAEQPRRAAFLQMQVQSGAAFGQSDGGSSSGGSKPNTGGAGAKPKSDNGVKLKQ